MITSGKNVWVEERPSAGVCSERFFAFFFCCLRVLNDHIRSAKLLKWLCQYKPASCLHELNSLIQSIELHLNCFNSCWGHHSCSQLKCNQNIFNECFKRSKHSKRFDWHLKMKLNAFWGVLWVMSRVCLGSTTVGVGATNTSLKTQLRTYFIVLGLASLKSQALWQLFC